MLESITILGSSSGRNAGDAALLAGIMASIDKVHGRRLRYEIPSLRPEFIWRSYENKSRPVSMLPWAGTIGMLGIPTIRSLLRTDMTLIYDAMLFDKKLYNPLFNYMSTARLLLPYAKKAGKILGCYNIGAGPVTTPQGRNMLRDIGNMMDFITVRDQDSIDLLREVGVTNPNMLLTADAAISVKAASDERIDKIMSTFALPTGEEILGINVNSYLNTWAGTGQAALTPDSFADVYAQGLVKALETIKAPVLFVCTQHSDIAITSKVMERLPNNIKCALFTNVEYGHHDIKGVLGRLSMLCAMRLHANILASSAYTPTIALAFQKKVTSYYKRLGLEDCVMSFNDFSAERLTQHLLTGWSNRSRIRQALVQHIPYLMEEADKAAEVVKCVGNGESAGAVIERIKASSGSSNMQASVCAVNQ